MTVKFIAGVAASVTFSVSYMVGEDPSGWRIFAAALCLWYAFMNRE